MKVRRILSDDMGLASELCLGKFRNPQFAFRNLPVMLKTDEGREKRTANIIRGTLLLRMATPDTLAKQRRRHPEGSLPSSKDSMRVSPGVFSQIGTSIVKKQKERALSLPGKLPAPNNSRDFSLRFGSGSPLPRINA